MPEATSLLSLVLTLRPAQTVAAPNGLGRATHAALLNAVRWSDPALAESLHAGSEARPITASGLIGHSRRASLSADRTYTLRYTALTQLVAQALLAAAHDGPLRIGASITLDSAALRIEAVTDRAPSAASETESDDPKSTVGDPKSVHAWASATTYPALSAPWLLGRTKPESRLTLLYASPTTFKSRGMHVPVPLPGLAFGSLLEKWNAFAPVALPAEVKRYAEECLALAAYRLGTRMVQVKEGGLRAGAVGQARYVTLNYDRYWMSLIHLLADFAFFAGVGVGTTTGLGQCRRIEDFDARDGSAARPRLD